MDGMNELCDVDDCSDDVVCCRCNMFELVSSKFSFNFEVEIEFPF